MSIDYDFGLCVGFIIPMDDVTRPFTIKVEEQSHLEKRFDPKTGERLEDAKIIDQRAGEQLKFGDHDLDDLYDLCDKLSELLHCEVKAQETENGWGESVYFILTNDDLYTSMDELSLTYNIDVGESMYYNKVCEQSTKNSVTALKFNIEHTLTIDIGDPKIFIESRVG